MELLPFNLSEVPQGWALLTGVLFCTHPDDWHVGIVRYWDGAGEVYEVQANNFGVVNMSQNGNKLGPTLFKAESLAACVAWWAIEVSNMPAPKVKTMSQKFKETFTG